MANPFLEYLVGTFKIIFFPITNLPVVIKFIVFVTTMLAMLFIPSLATVFTIAILIDHRYWTKVILCLRAGVLTKPEELTDSAGKERLEFWRKTGDELILLTAFAIFGLLVDIVALGTEMKTESAGSFMEWYKCTWTVMSRAAGIGSGLCIAVGVFKVSLHIALKLVSAFATTSPAITEARSNVDSEWA